MSKSNIRNINQLGIKKTPTLVYNDETYSDLLIRLKKNSMWSSFSKRNYYIDVKQRNGDYFLMCIHNLKYLHKKYKTRVYRFKVNPYLSNFKQGKETFFWTKLSFTKK